MRAAHQQHWQIDFTAINRLHVPVALASMLLVVDRCSAAALCAAGSTISRCSPATVTLALLGNAFVCGVISGPHDRYGARMAWVATFVVLIAAIRHFAGDEAARPLTSAVTKIQHAGLVDLVADRAHVVAVRNIQHFRARNDLAKRLRPSPRFRPWCRPRSAPAR